MKAPTTFLHLLHQQNKKLFWGVLFFVLAQAFFTCKGVENTPFFNYGMYSSTDYHQEQYTKNIIYAGRQKIILSAVPFRSRAFLGYQLRYRQKLIANDTIDAVRYTVQNRFGNTALRQYLEPRLTNSKAAIHHFKPWLSSYISKEKISFKILKYRFKNGRFQQINEGNTAD